MGSLLFLSGFFPDELREEIIINSKSNAQLAADTLQKGFLDGLSVCFPNLEVLNLPFIGAYPTRYKKLFLGSCKVGLKGNSKGYFNLLGIKNLFIYKKTKNSIKKWVLETPGKKVILIYSIQLPFLKAATAICKKYPEVKICQIVPDLPQYMGGPKSYLHTLYRNISINMLSGCYKYIDSYVFLSKYMAEYFDVKRERWTVVEGIFSGDLGYEQVDKKNVTVKTILYTGTLSERFGILNLLSAFKIIPNKNYRLIICGDGDTKNKIIEESERDSRIIFKGVLNRNEILRLQKEATLLVNPRTPEGEFTKFSFPSKTMEYLASGTPTLLYKLPGIPDEYYDYCYTMDDLSIESFANNLYNICETDVHELEEKGARARRFILEKKNPVMQCKKVAELINKLF